MINLLYLFYKKVQRANPTCEIWLIEDNTLAHQKAAKMYANIIKKKAIKMVDTLANSPDLQFIEDILDREKKWLVLNRMNWERLGKEFKR